MKTPLRAQIFEDRPLLERLGFRLMRRISSGARPVHPDDPIHLLDSDERRAIRSVEKGAVIRAVSAGALTALIAALTELWLRANEAENATLYWGGSARYWMILGVVVGGATLVEMIYLYWDSLRSVHRLSVLAGHELFAEEQHAVVECALVRAALELPNPREPIFGVDPHREVSRWRAAALGFLYKLKVGLTNFLLRALLRRAAGRAALRSWIPFVAIPITGLWNGLTSWRVMREARVRAFGPSAIAEFVGRESFVDLPKEAAEVTVQGVASAIVKTRDRHPNIALLLARLIDEHRLDEIAVQADAAEFIRRLKALPKSEGSLVLQTLLFAAILDGRTPKRERDLIQQAFAATGRSFQEAELKKLKRDFLSGREAGRNIVGILERTG